MRNARSFVGWLGIGFVLTLSLPVEEARAQDVTLRDSAGAVKSVAPGTKVSTTSGEVSRYEVEGVFKAETVPCVVCGRNDSAVVSSGKGKTALAIRHGGIALDVSRLPDKSTFEVVSAMAVAAVRGTKFSGLVHHEGTETYVVQDGVVDVTAKGKSHRIMGGAAIDIAKDGTASTRAATRDEIFVKR